MDSAWYLGFWGRLQSDHCQLPTCCCPHALLYVWSEGKRTQWEVRTCEGKRFEGGAPSLEEAKRFGAVTVIDEGLSRVRVVFGRPVEVPRA